MIAGRVVGPERVHDDDVEIGAHEREVVVAAVPHDAVGLGGRLPHDGRVVDAGEYYVADGEVRLELLALLYAAACGVEVGEPCKALHALLREVAVRHRMPEDRHAQPALAQPTPEPTRDWRLAAPGAHGRHGDHRHRSREHRDGRPEQHEVRTAGERPRGEVHDVEMRDVAVSEDHVGDALATTDGLEHRLVLDRDAVRIARAGQCGREPPPAPPGRTASR